MQAQRVPDLRLGPQAAAAAVGVLVAVLAPAALAAAVLAAPTCAHARTCMCRARARRRTLCMAAHVASPCPACVRAREVAGVVGPPRFKPGPRVQAGPQTVRVGLKPSQSGSVGGPAAGGGGGDGVAGVGVRP